MAEKLHPALEHLRHVCIDYTGGEEQTRDIETAALSAQRALKAEGARQAAAALRGERELTGEMAACLVESFANLLEYEGGTGA